MSAPQIGICDFCDEGNVPVLSVGKTGYRMAGFCSCQKCTEKAGFTWPDLKPVAKPLIECDCCKRVGGASGAR